MNAFTTSSSPLKRILVSSTCILLVAFALSVWDNAWGSAKVQYGSPERLQTKNRTTDFGNPKTVRTSKTTNITTTVNTTVDDIDNRTIVIIIGNLRCGESAWKTLYENVLDVNHADLALLLGDVDEKYQSASLFQRAKYVWRFDEYEDWADALDTIDGPAWRETLYLGHRGKAGGVLGGIRGYGNYSSGAIQGMMKYWLSARIRQQGLLERYDRFVVTRSDSYYQCPEDLSLLDNNHIWVPEGEDYGGIYDRHFICNSTLILPALDVLPPFLNQEYNHKVYSRLSNPETLLRLTWRHKHLPIQRIPRVMFTCYAQGDQSRGALTDASSDGLRIYQDVFVKYKDGFKLSNVTCTTAY